MKNEIVERTWVLPNNVLGGIKYYSERLALDCLNRSENIILLNVNYYTIRSLLL